jgi:ribonuclease P protein component
LEYPNEFKRKSRLLTARDFRFVFENAKRSSSEYLTVLARPNGKDYARLGLVVSKKSVKLAVGRNRIKRLTRESFRLNQELLAGLDVIVLSKRGINEKKNSDILSDLGRHWKKLAR